MFCRLRSSKWNGMGQMRLLASPGRYKQVEQQASNRREGVARYQPAERKRAMFEKLESQPEGLEPGMLLHDYQLAGCNWLRRAWYGLPSRGYKT